MNNHDCKEQLKILYGVKCMLTGLESKKLTYHHIMKKEHGGKTTIENGSNLINEIHAWLHKMECNDKQTYHLVNECLELYKQCMDREDIELINEWEAECQPKLVKKIRRNK